MSSKTGKIFILLLLLFLFFIKIDFHISGAIEVVLAQIQIYLKLNKVEQTSYTVLFLNLDNEYESHYNTSSDRCS